MNSEKGYTSQGLVKKLSKLLETTNLNSRSYEDVQEAHLIVKELDRQFNDVYNLPEND